MRITIDLPDNLLRAARVRAAESGVTFKAFFERAVTRQLETTSIADQRPRSRQVAFPLVGSQQHQRQITNDDIETALANDEIAKDGQ